MPKGSYKEFNREEEIKEIKKFAEMIDNNIAFVALLHIILFFVNAKYTNQTTMTGYLRLIPPICIENIIEKINSVGTNRT